MATGVPTKKKPCKICGNMFLPSKPSQRICNASHYSECPICGKQIVWNSTRPVEPCSKECRKERTRRNNLLKYGCEHPMQNKQVQANHKKSMVDKYGVEFPLQSDEIRSKVIATNQQKFGCDWSLSSSEIKDKSKQTMSERYGAPTTLQSQELRNKVEQTNLNKYGTTNAMQNEDVKAKAENTLMNRYGVDNPMKIESVKAQVQASRQDKMDEIVANARQTYLSHLGVDNPSKSPDVLDKIEHTMFNRYGYKNAIQVPEFRESLIQTNLERYEYSRHGQDNNVAQIRKRFSDVLNSNGILHYLEKQIGLKSFDAALQGRNILIEIDPTYTHNSIGNHWNKSGLPKNYHLEKTKLANEHGYRCIHVFDWDDTDKIINMVRPTDAIYARKCKIYRLNKNVATDFLSRYHLQGSCRGQLLCLGLVYNDELYQVMTFGKSRYDKKYSVELLRLCTRPRYTVIGGASKLFKFATQDYGLNNIISYCDLSKFTGSVYEKIGMKLVRTTPPQEIWSKGSTKVTANLLRQRGYDQLFNTHYGKGVNNEELMLKDGWLPVYDCGQAVYEFS